VLRPKSHLSRVAPRLSWPGADPAVCPRGVTLPRRARGLQTSLLQRAVRAFAALIVSLVLFSFVALASADDLSSFEAARARYERHEYARAVDAFRALVGTDPPRVANALLVLESRKYFAASLLFVGSKEEARAQFRLLLQQEPDYTLDPLAFPTEVVALFDEIKEAIRHDLSRKREAEQQRELEAQRDLLRTEQQRRTNLRRLQSLAESQELLVQNSRWIATVPFGVGQFQNGDRGLGVALAMAQGLAVATSVVSYIGHQRIADDNPTMQELRETRRVERVWQTTNLVSFSTFAALALIGIVDAHVRFVPGHVRAKTRPLPADLQYWLKQQGRGFAPVFRF